MKTKASLSVLTLCVLLGVGSVATPVASQIAPPEFSFQPSWMTIPPQYAIGEVSAVAVDRTNNVWVLQRPATIAAADRGRAAPPVVQFDSSGKFLQAWGGPGNGYDWPANEHSLFVDEQDRVWISGSSRAAGAGDHYILVFSKDGRLLRQIGRKDASKGDQDTANVNAAADMFVDAAQRELYVADGYGNHRVIVFDSETGGFKRMWGAFGRPPQSPPTAPAGAPAPVCGPEGPPTFSTVHGIELARDGLLYVSDRNGQRVQAFDQVGAYQGQVFIHRDAPNRATASGLGLSPDQQWLYVADFGNCRLAIVDRKRLESVKDIGACGSGPGQFQGPHIMAVDRTGAIYVAEVAGRRIQKLIPKP